MTLATVKIGLISKIGGRERNEDSCAFAVEEDQTCLVLSDGAGGHGGGDVASRIAVDTIMDMFASNSHSSMEFATQLVTQANTKVVLGQQNQPEISDMRATLVVCLIDTSKHLACWGHIGDSRLYCFRDGMMVFQSRDHSLFQSMVDAGFAKAAAARGRSDRSVLTGSLGSEEDFLPEFPSEPFGLFPGDALLLCSDGFWEFVDENAMLQCLLNAKDPDDWLAKMEVELEKNKRPRNDNFSAIGLFYGEQSQ
jgi:PPM family protein phosphatase